MFPTESVNWFVKALKGQVPLTFENVTEAVSHAAAIMTFLGAFFSSREDARPVFGAAVLDDGALAASIESEMGGPMFAANESAATAGMNPLLAMLLWQAVKRILDKVIGG